LGKGSYTSHRIKRVGPGGLSFAAGQGRYEDKGLPAAGKTGIPQTEGSAGIRDYIKKTRIHTFFSGRPAGNPAIFPGLDGCACFSVG
jgi:hypothetical protein